MATEMTPSATNLFCAPRSRDRCLSEVPLFTNGFHPVGHSKYSKRTSSIKVKRVTDRVDLDLDLWPSVSIPSEPWQWPTLAQKVKVKCQSVRKSGNGRTDRQTDGRRRSLYLPC